MNSAPAPAPAPAKPPRLVSLDALRGFDMFWILGGDAAMRALGKIVPVGPMTTLAGQFEHKDWAGFAFYDLIFPLFVFVVGVSSVFSLSRIVQQHGRGEAIKRVLLRTALIYALGLFYAGGMTQPWPGLRLLGVLQRIALAYGATGLLFCFFKPRALAGITAAILVGYWALLTLVPIRDFTLDKAAIAARLGTDKATPAQIEEAFNATTARVTGGYAPGLNLTNHLDFQFLPGRKYDTYYDPEGFLSTLPRSRDVPARRLRRPAAPPHRSHRRAETHRPRDRRCGGDRARASVGAPVPGDKKNLDLVVRARGRRVEPAAAGDVYYVVDVRGANAGACRSCGSGSTRLRSTSAPGSSVTATSRIASSAAMCGPSSIARWARVAATSARTSARSP